ncbi:hypothetical protein MMC06_006521 [Schaereria dolodes]|nr:hypothetical protein [Schaereria dolodes]
MSFSAVRPNASSNETPPFEKSYYERQRDALVREIGVSLEHVLQNINTLNRSLEGVIAVGNEFGSVEALWSQFENVMAKDPDTERDTKEDDQGKEHDQEGEEIGRNMTVRSNANQA